MIFLIVLIASCNMVSALPLGAGICYAGCATMVCACYAAAGFTFGTLPAAAIAATPALAKCTAAFAVCEKLCIVALIAPIP